MDIIKTSPQRAESKGIRSVEIGYRVLLAVQRGPGPVQLTEIARRSGLGTGAAHNYLTSLVRTGMVEQEGRGMYSLGPSAFALSLASFRQLDGYEIVKDEAQRLYELTGQGAGVSVWSQGGPVSIFIQRPADVGLASFRSGLVPILGTAAGTVFTAYLAEALTAKLIGDAIAADPCGDRDVHTVIAEARAQVLPRGYGYIYRHDIEFHMLAVPVWTLDDRIAFTLSLLSRDKRADPSATDSFLPYVIECADRAGLLLGGSSTSGPQAYFRRSVSV